MGKFENGVLGLLPSTDWLDISTSIDVTRPTDPIDSLFGDVKTDNIMAEWESIKSQYTLPGIAYFHGFDTEAHTAVRMPLDKHNIEKGLIKQKINQSERLRAIYDAGERRESRLYDFVFNDIMLQADNVISRTKLAKYEIMATGGMTIKENNLDLTIDYGVPDENKALELDFGAGAEKDIPSQIQDIVDMAKDSGVKLNGLMTASKNITKMRNDPALQRLINGSIGAGVQLRRSQLETYLADEYGINNLIEADLRYRVDKGIKADGTPDYEICRYFPENKVTFFAAGVNGQMGTGLWGDPPEADRTDLHQAEPSGESPFVWITQKKEWDPAVVWTKASALFIPMLYMPDSLFISTTKSTPGT